MTVQELINRLEEIHDKNQIVLVALDIEGNNCSPLFDGFSEDQIYLGNGQYTTNIDDEEFEYESYMERAIILWPV